MIILPAIDIKEGRCVRLYRGDFNRETVYGDDPAAMARRWEGEGASLLHLIDLDGAVQGRPVNRKAVTRILEGVKIPVELGGGIRTPETVEDYLSAGVKRVILGTKAAQSLDFLADLYREFGDRILPAIDAEKGRVVVKGWVEKTDLRAEELGKDLRRIGFKLAIYTDTASDGTLSGPNLAAIEDFLDGSGLRVIAAGGIAGNKDILNLKKLERKGLIGAITGQAIYSGKLDLKEAIRIAR